MSNRLTELGVAGAIGLSYAAMQTESIAIGAHGERSHRANGQAPWLKYINDHLMWFSTVDATNWSSAHVGDVEVGGQTEGIMHHGMPDTNLFPVYEIERYLRTTEKDRERYGAFPTLDIHATHPNLDPSARYSYEEVRRLGSFAIDVVSDVLGDDYTPDRDYSLEDAERVLDTSEPRYYYGPARRHPKDTLYSQDEKAKILLADPYSPALEPIDDKIHNGPFGIYRNNVTRYRAAADFFRAHPEYIRPMLRDHENDAPKRLNGPAVLFTTAAVGFALASVKQNGLSIKNALAGALIGEAAAGLGTYAPIKGGQIVNGWGHAGLIKAKELVSTFRNFPHELRVNKDGTYMTRIDTDSKAARLLLRSAGAMFWGELIGQPPHHANPGDRHYTFEEGYRGYLDEPITGIVKASAKRGLFGLRPPEGFDVEENQRRPDMPNSAVVNTVQPARVRSAYPELYYAA